MNGDGFPDIICGGGRPNVTAFDGRTGKELLSFMAYSPYFTGGITVAAGDVNGAGHADIIVGTGVGGGPNVAIFDGKTGPALINSFMAFNPNYFGGGFSARAISRGTARRKSSPVPTWRRSQRHSLQRRHRPEPGQLQRVFQHREHGRRFQQRHLEHRRTVAGGEINDNGYDDILVVGGPNTTPTVAAFNGETYSQDTSFTPFSTTFYGGTFIGASR